MDNFKIIYRILKHLEAAMDYPEADMAAISPQQLGISRERYEQLLILLQDDGYIRGLSVIQTLDELKRRLAYPIEPAITLKGLEYLADNSLMKKAAALLRGIKETIPGI